MSQIFDPKNKILANVDRLIEFIQTGNTSPVLVEFDPSNACNHGCLFCISSYIHLKESKHLATFNRSIMNKEVLLKTCKDLVDLKVRAINWTGGGEPTINPYLKEAITYVGENSDIKMGIFTNGSLLDKFDLFETFVKYLTWVRISIDFGKEETYNKIRRPQENASWNKVIKNIKKLIEVNSNKIDIGIGFVITEDSKDEIVDFAKYFSEFNIKYCQFKPEIVNREREDGIQRTVDFWRCIEPSLKTAKEILGDKFQINDYKLDDLINDPINYGRNYKKCIGSQLQPCIGADGNVYVCTNHRGYKEYSYGSLYDKSFIEIWNDIHKRMQVMNQIEEVEKFSKCTKLCKPHESNKICWGIYQGMKNISDIKHKEFI